MKPSTTQQTISILRRLSSKFGTWDDGKVKDWTEWVECREVIAALESELAQPTGVVFLVATGEITNGMEQYTRHDVCPPLCDAEMLYTAPQAVNAELLDALDGTFALAIGHAAAYQFGHDLKEFHPTHQAIIDKARAVLKKAGGAP